MKSLPEKLNLRLLAVLFLLTQVSALGNFHLDFTADRIAHFILVLLTAVAIVITLVRLFLKKNMKMHSAALGYFLGSLIFFIGLADSDVRPDSLESIYAIGRSKVVLTKYHGSKDENREKEKIICITLHRQMWPAIYHYELSAYVHDVTGIKTEEKLNSQGQKTLQITVYNKNEPSISTFLFD